MFKRDKRKDGGKIYTRHVFFFDTGIFQWFNSTASILKRSDAYFLYAGVTHSDDIEERGHDLR